MPQVVVVRVQLVQMLHLVLAVQVQEQVVLALIPIQLG